MTLSERNTFFKAGIVFCAVCVFLILTASLIIIPHYQENDFNVFFGDEQRPVSLFQTFVSRFINSNYLAVHISLSMTIIFSLIGMLLIHYYFERTSTPEIIYIAIFTISMSFEVIRLILPLQQIFIFSSFYVNITSHALLFARYFGIFSLFAASICAAGLEIQKTRNVIFITVVAALIITISVPIDVLNWDTSLNVINGYVSLFRMIELGVLLTTMISFLIAARIRESDEYIYVAVGSLLALIGRNILLNTDNWIGPLPGIILLSFGTWFLCSKLHKIHLWL